MTLTKIGDRIEVHRGGVLVMRFALGTRVIEAWAAVLALYGTEAL